VKIERRLADAKNLSDLLCGFALLDEIGDLNLLGSETRMLGGDLSIKG